MDEALYDDGELRGHHWRQRSSWPTEEYGWPGYVPHRRCRRRSSGRAGGKGTVEEERREETSEWSEGRRWAVRGFMARVLEGTRCLPPLPHAGRSEPILACGRVASQKRPNRPFLPDLARNCFKVHAVQKHEPAQTSKQGKNS